MVDWKKCLLVLLMLASAVSLVAQGTYTPPVLPPIFNAADLQSSGVLMTNVGANVKVYTDLLLKHDSDIYSPTGALSVLRTAQQADAKAISVFVDQSAQITSLKAQLTADELRITALETKLAALATKTVTAGTTLATP